MQSRRLTLRASALLLNLLLGLSLPCPAQEPANTPNPTEQPQPQQPQHQDAPAPEPHPDLKALVDAIRNLLNEGKHAEALQQADALLQQATEKGDTIGQAYAFWFRAMALQRLNKLAEAVPVWEQAERLWRGGGWGVGGGGVVGAGVLPVACG
ncbi:MAG: hypothetical protein ABDI19_00010 [Armatimonadota bacterium]